KNGGSLVKGNVAGGLTAAQVIVVHGRQVVMDEAVGMNTLKGTAHCVNGGADLPHRLGAGIGQYRSDAFAIAGQAVAHSLIQAQRNGLQLGKVLLERLLITLLMMSEETVDIDAHRQESSSSVSSKSTASS